MIKFIVLLLSFSSTMVLSQKTNLDNSNLTAIQTSLSIKKINNEKVVRVVKSPKVLKDDEATYVKINDIKDFKNGTIEVQVLSKLLSSAPAHARGFIGLAFRINEDDSEFESLYIRPTNSTAEDQLRRNRTVQYFSFPNFKFFDSRAVAPGTYETYANVSMEEWIDLKIEVNGKRAKLFINKSEHPNFIVNDLKMGEDASGSIGLFVDIGTEGFFKNLKVIQN